MSYIQLELGGKARGLKFNQMAVITMTNYLDFNNLAATYGYALIYAGLVANCYVKREEPDFTFEQVCDWVETLTPEQLTEVRTVFESTQTFKTLQESQEPKEEMTKKAAEQQGEGMKIALGHLGWSEREYFESSPESVYYAFQGYFDKRKHEERMFRNVAWISYKTGGGKEKNINSFWPIDEVKKEDVKVWGSKEEKDELLKKIMEAHKIKLDV